MDIETRKKLANELADALALVNEHLLPRCNCPEHEACDECMSHQLVTVKLEDVIRELAPVDIVPIPASKIIARRPS